MRLLRQINKRMILLVAAVGLAGGSGFLVSQALGVSTLGNAQTVTINVATGPQGSIGPPGPQGDPGPAGPGITMKGSVATPGDLPATGNKPGDTYIVQSNGSIQTWDGTKWVSTGPIVGGGTTNCPTGFTPGELVINHPGGQTSIWTCLKG